jgi:phenylacetate-CoA ligase
MTTNQSRFEKRRQVESLTPDALANYQLERLNNLLDQVLPHNRFYSRKLACLERPIRSLSTLSAIPFTHKEELQPTEESNGLPANLTFPMQCYTRFHHTSGTRGRPMVVFDTADDWQWWIEGWQYVLDSAEVTCEDRALLAFSFGPFIGFWSAYDALLARGTMAIPSGGVSTRGRLELLRMSGATVLLCTPTYALHMAEVAEQSGFSLSDCCVRRLIVAGEPGGSVPEIRRQMENAYGAQVIDHAGATEVGPWGYGNASGTGLYINEGAFIAEFLSVETGENAREGELAELVLTTLGRAGSPVVRYRTGDVVRPTRNVDGVNRFVFLAGGVLGRSDEMFIVRGMNIFPSSIEQVIRSFPEIGEYRVTIRKRGKMDSLDIEIEDCLHVGRRVAEELHLRLGLRVEVTHVPGGSLPRWEGKSRRFLDQR